MLSFAKYFCILSICNLLLLHGITTAPTESDESMLEEKQHHCSHGQCWNDNQCGPCGTVGECQGGNCGQVGGAHQCPYGQHWNGNLCVPSRDEHGN